MSSENFIVLATTFKLHETVRCDGLSHYSFDLMDMGHNSFLSSDDYSQKMYRIGKALSLINTVKQMLEKQKEELQNE